MRWRTWGGGLAVVLVASCLWAGEKTPARPRGPAVPPTVKAYYDLEYIAAGHVQNRLDLYLPEKIEGLRPLIVCVHGGGWSGGSKENVPAFPLLEKGYAVASINYRLLQDAPFPAQIQDCKAAIRWLCTHARQYRLDAARGMWGHSAGGHLVGIAGHHGGPGRV